MYLYFLRPILVYLNWERMRYTAGTRITVGSAKMTQHCAEKIWIYFSLFCNTTCFIQQGATLANYLHIHGELLCNTNTAFTLFTSSFSTF